MATPYGKIYPYFQTRLKTTKARWDAAHRGFMSELYANLQEYFNAFEGYVIAQFVEIESSDLGHIREKVYTLRAKVCSLIEFHLIATPLFISLVVKISYPQRYIHIDLFAKNEEDVPVGETKRGHVRDL